MEASLGRGYSSNEDFGVTDFYSPPSSVIDEIDEQDDLFYTEDGEQDEPVSIVATQETTLPDSLIEDINTMALKSNLDPLKSPFSLKLISTGTTPPPTPLVYSGSLLPSNSTSTMTMNTQLPLSPSRSSDSILKNWSIGASNSSLFSRPVDNTPKTATSSNTINLLPPTNFDRYFADHRSLSSDSTSRSSSNLDLPLPLIPPPSLTTNRQSSMSSIHSDVNNDISRLYSYMNSVDDMTSPVRPSSSNGWPNSDEQFAFPMHSRMNSNNSYASSMNYKSPWLSNVNSYLPHSAGSINPTSSYLQQQQQVPPPPSMINPFQNQNSWLLSEMSAMLRQNQAQSPMVTFNSNITLSTTAQQILAANANSNNNNNRPLRSEKIDIEIIKHLIREAKWKRQCGLKKEVCVFCRNNGENELIYSSHSLKDSLGNVTCPILRAYQCPICGATGAQAHTIKYCQATGDDNNQHIPTPYEKMIRTQCMQTFGLDDNMNSSIPTLFDPLASPSSLYTNGWSNSYL